mgnify:CR=1 FL=1
MEQLRENIIEQKVHSNTNRKQNEHNLTHHAWGPDSALVFLLRHCPMRNRGGRIDCTREAGFRVNEIIRLGFR